MPDLLIKNTKVVFLDEISSEVDVLCKNSHIQEISSKIEPVIDSEMIVVDASGKYLAPGFIDLHIHGLNKYLIDNGIDESLHTEPKVEERTRSVVEQRGYKFAVLKNIYYRLSGALGSNMLSEEGEILQVEVTVSVQVAPEVVIREIVDGQDGNILQVDPEIAVDIRAVEPESKSGIAAKSRSADDDQDRTMAEAPGQQGVNPLGHALGVGVGIRCGSANTEHQTTVDGFQPQVLEGVICNGNCCAIPQEKSNGGVHHIALLVMGFGETIAAAIGGHQQGWYIGTIVGNEGLGSIQIRNTGNGQARLGNQGNGEQKDNGLELQHGPAPLLDSDYIV